MRREQKWQDFSLHSYCSRHPHQIMIADQSCYLLIEVVNIVVIVADVIVVLGDLIGRFTDCLFVTDFRNNYASTFTVDYIIMKKRETRNKWRRLLMMISTCIALSLRAIIVHARCARKMERILMTGRGEEKCHCSQWSNKSSVKLSLERLLTLSFPASLLALVKTLRLQQK